MAASYEDHSTIIKLLLDNEADTGITSDNGYNVLHWAVGMNEIFTTTVELLLNKMKLEDINHINGEGDTPLDVCYDENDSPIRQQLIQLIRLKGGKRASELRKRASNSNADDTVTKRQRTQLYLTLSNLKF